MPHGKICYLEIPANKAEDAAAFYSNIFGWNVRQRGDGSLAFDDAGSVSGTWVKEEDHTPDERTRVYIMVDNIAASLEQIEGAWQGPDRAYGDWTRHGRLRRVCGPRRQ